MMSNIGTDFNPVFAGLVLKHEVGTKEVVASFVSMLQRGIIRSKNSEYGKLYSVGEYDPDSILISEKMILDKMTESGESSWPKIKEILADISIDKKYINSVDMDLENVGKKSKRKTMMGQMLNKLTMDSISKAGFIIIFFGSLFIFIVLIMLQAGDLYICPFLTMVSSLVLIPGIMKKYEHKDYDKLFGVRQRSEYLDIFERIKDIPQSAYTMHDEDLAFAISFELYKDFDGLLR